MTLRINGPCNGAPHDFGPSPIMSISPPDGVSVNVLKLLFVWEQDCVKCGEVIRREFRMMPEED